MPAKSNDRRRFNRAGPGAGRPEKGNTRRFPLRLPPDLHADVAEAAKIAGRSQNDEIIAQLQERNAMTDTEAINALLAKQGLQIIPENILPGPYHLTKDSQGNFYVSRFVPCQKGSHWHNTPAEQSVCKDRLKKAGII